MPLAKKAKTSAESSNKRKLSHSPQSGLSKSFAKTPQRKAIVSKTKSAKKETLTQTNTLFDFYPNLSKNAPLFRPVLAGDVSPESASSRGDTSVATQEYDLALAILENGSYEKEKAGGQVSAEQEPFTEGPSSTFGPFALDDDDLDNHARSDLDQTNSKGQASPLNANIPVSDRVALKSFESDIPSDTETQYATSIADQIHSFREDGAVEIDIAEERDRFENADDEENEDEEWSWQEYNAENFGEHVSRDEAVLCPVCGQSIIALSEHDRSAHVNHCLDLPPPSKEENTVAGQDLIDATVKREMNASPSPPALKREASDPIIKPEPEDPVMDQHDEDRNGFETPKIKTESLAIKNEFGMDHEDKIKTEDEKKPQLARGASNAFEKIMVNHTEEKQWANAARVELAQRGTKYKTRVCPFYKILSPFPIAVDAFKYGTVPGIEGYYLTHFHSDHYGGLSSTWDAGPIYCSSITGSLVIQQLRVRPEYVVKLPMDSTTDVNGVKITLIDANHCPGSTLFLFEGTARGRNLRYLHCGDFRATPAQLLHPAVRGKKIDSLYLDTTYLSPKYAFPTQEDVIEACAHVCRDLAGLLPEGSNPVADARNASGISKFLNQKSAECIKTEKPLQEIKKKKPRGRLLVVVGTYSIGKERIVLGIAKALNSKIFAAQRKRDILSCLEDPELESRITTDPLEAQVHMTYLQEIRAETLNEYLTQFLPHFERIVGFRGTGWTYTPPKTRFLDSPTVDQIMSWNPRYSFHHMNPGRGSTGTAACYGVPYSEHSSFRELMCFCLSADLGRVIPTVNVGSEKSRKLMKSWIDRWALEVRKNGIRPIPDDREWR